jgi:hypothetical protein
VKTNSTLEFHTIALSARPHRIRIGTALFSLAALACAPPAHGDDYTGSVLYKLNPPPGVTVVQQYEWAAGGQVVGYGSASGGSHAILWKTNGVAIDLNPAGFANSYGAGTNGTQQVGWAYDASATNVHAFLWNGTSGGIDLNPAGFAKSYAANTSGSQQVGYARATASSSNHAFLWTGTAASAVDLNPSGVTNSGANGTNGTQQVGAGDGHALLWTGTAASVVDLNPAGYFYSGANAIGTTQQVGTGGQTNLIVHALIWSGTAASAVDLNPSGFTQTEAYETNDSYQVGYGFGSATANKDHALLWAGTPESLVDLATQLPATGTWSNSYATSIDSSGNIFGWAVGTYSSVSGTFAVKWSPGSRSRTSILRARLHRWCDITLDAPRSVNG